MPRCGSMPPRSAKTTASRSGGPTRSSCSSCKGALTRSRHRSRRRSCPGRGQPINPSSKIKSQSRLRRAMDRRQAVADLTEFLVEFGRAGARQRNAVLSSRIRPRVSRRHLRGDAARNAVDPATTVRCPAATTSTSSTTARATRVKIDLFPEYIRNLPRAASARSGTSSAARCARTRSGMRSSGGSRRRWNAASAPTIATSACSRSRS